MYLHFDYTNYKGETAKRRAVPMSVRFGTSQWHAEPQWLLMAVDGDKSAMREFAVADMKNVQPNPTFLLHTLDMMRGLVTKLQEISHLRRTHYKDGEPLPPALEAAIGVADECLKDLSQATSRPLPANEQADRVYIPEQPNEYVIEALSLKPWQHAEISEFLRLDGTPVKTRYEDEQAAAILFVLPLAIKHGPEWHRKVGEYMQDVLERNKDKFDANGKLKPEHRA